MSAQMEAALLRLSEAATYLGIGETRLRGLVADGKLKWIDLSGGDRRRAMRFHRSDLDDYLRGDAPEPGVAEMGYARKPIPKTKQAALRRRPSIVYFIRSGPFVKIGTTRNLKSRLQNLQISHPTPIKLAATLPGGVEVERQLHRQFEGLRVNGEWFREVDDLAVLIANNAPAEEF